MIDWFQTLDPQVKPYWAIAIVMSAIFIIQMILTFIGIGDTNADADFGTDMPDGVNLPDGHADTLDTGGAVQLFTIRNAVNSYATEQKERMSAVTEEKKKKQE